MSSRCCYVSMSRPGPCRKLHRARTKHQVCDAPVDMLWPSHKWLCHMWRSHLCMTVVEIRIGAPSFDARKITHIVAQKLLTLHYLGRLAMDAECRWAHSVGGSIRI